MQEKRKRHKHIFSLFLCIIDMSNRTSVNMTVLAQPSILILLFIAQRDKLGYAFIVDGSPQKYVYFKKKYVRLTQNTRNMVVITHNSSKCWTSFSFGAVDRNALDQLTCWQPWNYFCHVLIAFYLFAWWLFPSLLSREDQKPDAKAWQAKVLPPQGGPHLNLQ